MAAAGPLEASGDRLEICIDRGQASSIPARAGTAVFSPNTYNLGGLCTMCIPTLTILLQISEGPRGLGVKTHTSKLAFKALPNLTNAHISQLVSWCKKRESRVSPKLSPMPVLG